MSGQGNSYIAIVDDDESACRALARLLRAAGFQPVPYRSEEALLGDRNRPRFDCLVLDIQLAGSSGLELSRRFAAIQEGTPVVFITAGDDPGVREAALAQGCLAYFTKWDSCQEILEAIRKAGGISPDEELLPDS